MQNPPRNVQSVNDDSSDDESTKTGESSSNKRRSALMSTRLSREYIHGFDFSADPLAHESASPIAEEIRHQAAPSIFDSLPTRIQHTVLNELLQCHSSHATTAVILMTLPAPDSG